MMSRLLPLLLVASLLVGCGESAPSSSPSTPSDDATPSHPARIVVDGAMDDWTAVPVRHSDASGDGGALDLGRLWIAHDDRYVFLRLEVGTAINLQEGNDLRLVLDADADASTGTATRGLGAELTWTFGERSGQLVTPGGTEDIQHEAIGIATLPTVRSDVFEIAFDRSATADGAALFEEGTTIRVAFDGGGDRLPDADGGLGYTLSPGSALDALPSPTIGRTDAAAVRLLSYNVQRDRFFDAVPRSAYSRLFKAMQPDVIAFQEIYESSAARTQEVVESLLPSGTGETWHAAKLGLDLVLVSRYPILEQAAIPGFEDYESAAFLLDARDVLGTPLLVVNAHPPCCNYADAEPSRDAQRQRVVDGIAAFLRDVRRDEAPFDVPDDTPILVAGDMNFVGDAQQPQTLATGTVVNTDRFGPSGSPDWDGSSLLDVNPRQTGAPLHATWMGIDSSFPPGRLDYLYASDSVVDVLNAYVLRTSVLDASTRTALSLEPDDTRTASDHLPLVLDVAPAQ